MSFRTRRRRSIHVIPELGEDHEFSLAHLSFGLLHESALLGGEDVIAPFFCSATATKSPSWRLRVSIISRGMTTWRRWPTRPIRSWLVVDFTPIPLQIICLNMSPRAA